MPSGRRKKSKDEAKAALQREGELAGAKRRRSIAEDVQRTDKRPRVIWDQLPAEVSEWVRINDILTVGRAVQIQLEQRKVRQRIQRPGIPAPTRTSAFVVPDRPSPPWRDDDKVKDLQKASRPDQRA